MAAFRSLLAQPALLPLAAVIGITLTTSFGFASARDIQPLEARTAFAKNYSTSSDGSAIAKAVSIRRKNADRTAMRLALEVKENTSTHIVGGTRRRSGIIY